MDHFGRLSDEVLLLIFNRIEDFKMLCRCCAVSKRFDNLATKVDNVVLKIEPGMMVLSDDQPLQCFLDYILDLDGIKLHLVAIRWWPGRTYSKSGASHYSPVLKKFGEISVLNIELPDSVFIVDDSKFLEGKPEFRPFIHCVLLFAPAYRRSKSMRKGPAVSHINSHKSISICGPREDQICQVGHVVTRFTTLDREDLLEIIAEHSNLDSFVQTVADGRRVMCMTCCENCHSQLRQYLHWS